jgi:hypothetical protein
MHVHLRLVLVSCGRRPSLLKVMSDAWLALHAWLYVHQYQHHAVTDGTASASALNVAGWHITLLHEP